MASGPSTSCSQENVSSESAGRHRGSWLRARVSLRPVLEGQPFEPGEISVVCGGQNKRIDMSDGGDLAVDERRWSAHRVKPRPLFAVPRRRSPVVRQNWKRYAHDVMEIHLQRGPASPSWQPATPVGELVPDWRRNGALRSVLVQTGKNRRVRSFRDRGRDDWCVQKIRERHSDTLRPVVLSRVEAVKFSSMPISLREYFSRNRLYASPKCRRFPRSRSNSRLETRTATGCPRRVNSTATPASASSTMLGRRDRASVIEYLCDTRQVYIKMYMFGWALDSWALANPKAQSREPKAESLRVFTS